MYSAKFFLAAALIVHAAYAQAHSSTEQLRPDTHAPAGVMADHLHSSDELMLGYRFEYASQSSLLQGSKSVSADHVRMMGYSAIPTSMDMKMHMLDIMWAPNDSLTLMIMPHYMSMDMNMEMTMEMHSGPHGHSQMHGTMSMPQDMHADASMIMKHDHKVEGWGDTQMAALINLWRSGSQQLHTTQGISIPTGSIDQRNAAGALTHYSMQLGSGTYDYITNFTYLGFTDRWNWGAQLSAVIRLENQNNNGYRLGNEVEFTSWASFLITRDLALNSRLESAWVNEVIGEYNSPHTTASPSDFPMNTGGNLVQWGVGVNYVIPSTRLRGLRISAEYLIPVYEKVNGIQLGVDHSFNVALSKSF